MGVGSGCTAPVQRAPTRHGSAPSGFGAALLGSGRPVAYGVYEQQDAGCSFFGHDRGAASR
eukprot:7864585-Lingulodinium_polyedra.AAC.1